MWHSSSQNADRLGVLKRKSKGFRGFDVSIDPNWEIQVDPCPIHGVNGVTKLIVGGAVSVGAGPALMQSIAVALLLESHESVPAKNNMQAERLARGEKVLVRRFHFDYDTSLKNPAYPRSHVQYGGKAARHTSVSDVHYRLYSIDLPRIPFPPFDLVLTLDFFLHQFQTPLQDMVEEARWINLVKESERLWLRGYYQEAADHLAPNDRSGTLYSKLSQHVDWIN
jgi:hypothetical protein